MSYDVDQFEFCVYVCEIKMERGAWKNEEVIRGKERKRGRRRRTSIPIPAPIPR